VIAAVSEIATRMRVTMAQVALQWVMTHPEVSVVITGADTGAQLDENLGAFGVELTGDDLDRLNSLSYGLGVVGW
jgi:aryl-alcohol dehydrogenase-like predicted oxidoreductase